MAEDSTDFLDEQIAERTLTNPLFPKLVQEALAHRQEDHLADEREDND